VLFKGNEGCFLKGNEGSLEGMLRSEYRALLEECWALLEEYSSSWRNLLAC